MSMDRFVFADIETTGLDPEKELILEVGFRITDRVFETIDEFSVLIWDTPSYDEKFRSITDQFVLDMHDKSGLWEACQSKGVPLEEATAAALGWLNGHGVGKEDPICGSSVQFDRGFFAEHMPGVEALFSYRNIDTSTIKELCRRLNPRVYQLMEKYTSPQKLHRVLPDLTDTIDEISFYRDNFLFESLEEEVA